MFLDDAIRHRQTEARALPDTLGRVERIVNLRDVLRGDADTRIGDLCDKRSVVGCSGGDDDAPAIRNRIARVEDQVREDLLQLAGVAVGFGRVFGVTANDLDLAATQLRLK